LGQETPDRKSREKEAPTCRTKDKEKMEIFKTTILSHKKRGTPER
jgi:hypothetical protein